VDVSIPTNPPVVDGRRARRDRNRERVVDALLALYAEGNIAPSIDLVAERSGVSHRSVFRYFEDLEELNRVAVERHFRAHQHLFDLHLDDGPIADLADRVAALVAHRVRLYEAVAPVARVGRMRAPRHKILATSLDIHRSNLRRQVLDQFSRELAALAEPESKALGAAAAALCSLETLESMRVDQKLSADQTSAALTHALTRLFSSP